MKCLTIAACFLIGGCTIEEKHYTVGDCTIERVDGGQVVTCGADQLVVPDQMPLKAIVDPCGDGPGVDEVVLFFEGDLYIAWYKGLGMAILEPYTHYQTTDRQRCKFQITPNGLEEI